MQRYDVRKGYVTRSIEPKDEWLHVGEDIEWEFHPQDSSVFLNCEGFDDTESIDEIKPGWIRGRCKEK